MRLKNFCKAKDTVIWTTSSFQNRKRIYQFHIWLNANIQNVGFFFNKKTWWWVISLLVKWANSNQIHYIYSDILKSSLLGICYQSGDSLAQSKEARERAYVPRWGRTIELDRKEPLREGQSGIWTGKFKVGGRVCQVGIEGGWKNLEAWFVLICKICACLFSKGQKPRTWY